VGSVFIAKMLGPERRHGIRGFLAITVLLDVKDIPSGGTTSMGAIQV